MSYRACFLTVIIPAVAYAGAPGIGVFFKADEAVALREKVTKPPCKAIYEQLLKRADAAMAKWPEDKAKLRFDELVPKLPDIQTEFVPKDFLPEGGKAPYELGHFAFSAHGEAVDGANKGPVHAHPRICVALKTTKPGMLYATSYCNIHGLWESSTEIKLA